jgi:hypothetical protein
MKHRTAKYAGLAFLLILQLLIPTTMGSAQMAEPQPISLAVPDKWRGPYTQLLAGLGLKDPTAIVASTKFGEISSIYRPKSAIFRIEDGSTCREDMCLTFIGHLIDGHLVADAQFLAGPKMTRFDSAKRILDAPSFPLLFHGDKEIIDLYENPAGWIVVPEK